jgi:hypothetical protein
MRILIIDDKPETDSSSSEQMLIRLKKVQLELVELKKDIADLWVLNDSQDEIIPTSIDYSKYAYIFLHQSYDTPLLKDPTILINVIPNATKLVLFSGERKESLTYEDNQGSYQYPQNENHKHYEIRRSVYLKNFGNFLNTFIDTHSNEFRIEALYNSNYSVRKQEGTVLFETIINELEVSNDNAVNSKQFTSFFELVGYNNHQINTIKSNYQSMDYQNFYDTLERELQNL